MAALAALSLTASGLLVQASSWIAAGVGDPATAAPGGNDLAPWLQGGGSAAAVGGLVYVARMVIRGQLVPRSVSDRETELGAAIRAAGEREALAMKLTEDMIQQGHEGRAREQSMMNLMGQVQQQLADFQRGGQQ